MTLAITAYHWTSTETQQKNSHFHWREQAKTVTKKFEKIILAAFATLLLCFNGVRLGPWWHIVPEHPNLVKVGCGGSADLKLRQFKIQL